MTAISTTPPSISMDSLVERLKQHLPDARLVTDPLRRLAYGTDASFYRLVPSLVVRPQTEQELRFVIEACREGHWPMTFRAAGTSLSGQAITDGVLIQLGRGWRGAEVLDNGARIDLQPAVIGARANELLAPFDRKIGPDPASIASCMIGGIAANNASGMCCGTAQNTYMTLDSIRVVLLDGAVLDTADTASVEAFRKSHAVLLDGLERLAAGVRTDVELAKRIRHKYRLKNTTGYALNSLLDYRDGVDILAHLMIGSEGTLGCITRITYHTVPEPPRRAAAMIFFPDLGSACRATIALKGTGVAAVELMDRAGLRAVERQPGMPEHLRDLPSGATALLVDVREQDGDTLAARIDDVNQALEGIMTLEPVTFTEDPVSYALYWKVRKGLFPAVGAVRDLGTTVIIEDVAFPIERLEEGVAALTAAFKRHGYDDALLFGHALEGNLHFVFPQGFERAGEKERYQALMADVAQLVAVEFGGSLKAEHGTGRNMAPFVELEWGKEAYDLMWQIKALFDADHLLNPEVMLTRNPTLHLENLKPLPEADAIVDRCIECGFCEAVCPSRELTLTPRQRIVLTREQARLANLEQPTDADRERSEAFGRTALYDIDTSCAADGMCGTRCPVGINTGELVLAMREERHVGKQQLARRIGRHFSGVTRVARSGLRGASVARAVIGDRLMATASQGLHRVSNKRIPQWIPSIPAAAPIRVLSSVAQVGEGRDPVVYFPSCATRVFGADKRDSSARAVMEVVLALLDKAGYDVIIPEMPGHLCCGMPFSSKGMANEAMHKARELNRELLAASHNGRVPILFDTSPCSQQVEQHLDARLKIQEPVAFAHDYLLPRLDIAPVESKVAVHVTCSSHRKGLTEAFIALARACAKDVVVPEGISCCGFAGDKGLRVPELTASSLQDLAGQVVGCEFGVSNSRTCEMGMTEHSGLTYHSILELLDRASQPRGVNS
ncbi:MULTISPECIES: FAD-binding and (Fe-S)-binding domain-containing protein [unclassified Halomonas]|uniref:FAD-binding and (Fe-S)-binding domain-containing protein n=1 Tax=unclassified Halomonas TaxID=2609666 RepID=UPI0021BBDFEB|nr:MULTISPECIES: FAD-binding and (Fe-S)-binding domain-containing protein [unclassified Halomonas]